MYLAIPHISHRDAIINWYQVGLIISIKQDYHHLHEISTQCTINLRRLCHLDNYGFEFAEEGERWEGNNILEE